MACFVAVACDGSNTSGLNKSRLTPDGSTHPPAEAASLVVDTGGTTGAGGASGAQGTGPTSGGAPSASHGGTGGSLGELTKDAAAVTAIDAGADASGACTTDGDCAAPMRFCNTSRGKCVECLSDNHCPAPKTCGLSDHQCKFACTTSADCSDPHPYCDTRRQECVECLSDTNCTTGNKNVCDSVTRACVQCAANSDCSCLLLGQVPCCTTNNFCTCGLLVCL